MREKYVKNYDDWNSKKKRLNNVEEKRFSEKEIW